MSQPGDLVIADKNLNDLQEEIAAWSRATFRRTAGECGPLLTHLAREVGELRQAYDLGLMDLLGEEEVADVAILLLAFADLNDFSLWEAIEAKMAKNRARTWAAPDAAGVIEHAREEVGR